MAESAFAHLRTAAAIRERCANVAAAVDAGQSRHFRLDRSRLPAVAERVARVTRARYPDGQVPLHSRWRHLGDARRARLDARVAGRTSVGRTRARIELALVSVLLDAGAGVRWLYQEPGGGRPQARSEGLAAASFEGFMQGVFSSDVGDPCRVDAKALLRIDAATLAQMFQAGPDNPIVGLDGRVALLRRLGAALRDRPELFTADGLPGHLFDDLTHHRHAHHLPHANLHHLQPARFRHHLSAARILEWLLATFGAIWPGGSTAPDGTPLGDAWPHPSAGGDGDSAGWVPFHKLSQWLTYSLVEPFEWGGVQVNDLDTLTALPEYRNGGLLLDAGVILARDPAYAEHVYDIGDEWVVEWRALTVALIDELAPFVREILGVSAQELPMARLLEGGTWAAGREIAAELRPDGVPPVRIDSDGTMF